MNESFCLTGFVWCIRRLTAVVAALMVASNSAAGAQSQPDPQELKSLSIEELMQIDVTLATRRPEPVGTTAAAIQVITRDDIRRSGVTTIADALTLADGLTVARFNNGTWAISARGFSATAANKLLVMIDGRTEYSPLFSGAFWNMIDYVLDDVERIEVIRGPGATLWGANAVNGVINIVTRHSRDTQGTSLSVGSGNEDPALANIRYGGAARGATYRVYAKYAQRGSQVFNTGQSANDPRRRGQVGFRLDGGQPAGDTWVVKGDAFHSRDHLSAASTGEFTELALQGGWSRAFSADSRVDVQTYYRREYRRVPQQLTHYIDTFDLDLQHALTMAGRHRVVWGSRYRVNDDQTYAGTVSFDPAARTYSVWNAFAQDEIALRPDRVYLTAGVKMERNTFSGVDWQPNARARLQLGQGQMLWGAVSRAARRPTRLDADVRVRTADRILVAVGGGEAYKSEILVATELGYRVQPHPAVALDATVFVHQYDDLRSQELPPTGPPIVVGNTLGGAAHGVELAGTLQPVPAWRLHASYTYLDLSITRGPGSRDIGGGATEANDPRHQVSFRTSFDLTPQVELDAHWRRIGALPNPPVPAYAELNMRLGWRVRPRIEVSLAGQDLLHDHHPEFGALAPGREEFERSVRVGVAFRY
jgi:iron complex outermembrane receptor protein